MRRSKLAAHHMLNGGETAAWIDVGVGLKCVGDFGPAALARRQGLPVVGRVLDDGKLFGQGFDMNRHRLREHRDPAEWARIYYHAVLAESVAANPGIEWWSGPNENNFERDEREATDSALAAAMQADRVRVMEWYAEFLWHLAKELHWRGKRAVIGGWAVGNPLKEHNLWPHYVRALQACRDWRAILERHSYGTLDEDYSLRHRWDNREFTRLGYPALPVIISECGGDDVPGSGPPRTFYQTPARFWNELLHPLALALEDDDYVLFACVFTSGDGAAPAWHKFDVTGWGLTPYVVNFATSRDPLPPIGEDEMAQMTQEELQTIIGSSAVIETEAAKIRAIADKYLTPATPQPLYRVRVLVDALNVRSGPAVTFPDVGDVFKNAELGVYEVAPSGWLRIHVTDAEWISGGAAYTVRV